MTTSTKILSVLFICSIIFIWIGFKHYQSELQSANSKVIEVQQKANLPIGLGETSQEKQLKDQVKELNQQIQDDMKAKQALLESYSELQARYQAQGHGTLTSPSPIVIRQPEKSGEAAVLIAAPFAYDDFRLHAEGDAAKKTFSYKLDQKFEVVNAETKTKAGAINNYAELYELDSNGKRIGKLELTKYNTYKLPLDPKKFKWWDPNIDILVGGIVDRGLAIGLNGNIGMSVFSYGRYRNLDWRFLRLGFGIDKQGVELSISPAQYNIAQPVPIINNLWLTPSFGLQLDNKTYFLGLGVAAIL